MFVLGVTVSLSDKCLAVHVLLTVYFGTFFVYSVGGKMDFVNMLPSVLFLRNRFWQRNIAHFAHVHIDNLVFKL